MNFLGTLYVKIVTIENSISKWLLISYHESKVFLLMEIRPPSKAEFRAIQLDHIYKKKS